MRRTDLEPRTRVLKALGRSCGPSVGRQEGREEYRSEKLTGIQVKQNPGARAGGVGVRFGEP